MTNEQAHVEQKLLGFDIREMFLPTWEAARKEEFSLRLDAQKVLSTDPRVWPSVFDLETGIVRPSAVGFVQDLWSSLEALLRATSELHHDPHKSYCTIAIGWIQRPEDVQEVPSWASLGGGAAPRSLGSDWTFIGYDVSDEWLLSGLSNCGYSGENDLPGLRRYWSMHLNQFHLISELPRADEFRQLTNKRVREHAPFFVYSLWRRHDNGGE